MHCTTIVFVFTLALWIAQKILSPAHRILRIMWILVGVSWITHHFRDGQRHGIWLCPIGSLPPIPYELYLLIMIGFPVFLSEIFVITGYINITFQPTKLPRLQPYLSAL